MAEINPKLFDVALWRDCVAQQYCLDSVNSSSLHVHHVHSVWRLKHGAWASHSNTLSPDMTVSYCVLCICKDRAHSVFYTIHFSLWISFAEGALCIILILMCDYLFGNIYNRRCLSAVEMKSSITFVLLLQTQISSIVSVNLLFFPTEHLHENINTQMNA